MAEQQVDETDPDDDDDDDDDAELRQQTTGQPFAIVDQMEALSCWLPLPFSTQRTPTWE